jgi:tRNA pseudouridine55 synthase
VRALISDFGDAYCEELERTAVGPFRLADASGRLVPLAEALAFLPERELSREEADAVRHGRRLSAAAGDPERLRLTHDGELIAIGEPRAGELQPVIVFAPA